MGSCGSYTALVVLGPRCLCYPAAPVEPPDRPQILWIWVCGCLGTLRSSGSGCPDPQILWIWDPKTLRSEDLGSRACLGHLDLGVSMSIWPRILRIQDQYVLCTRTSEGRLLGPADLVASRHLYLSLCPIWGIASWRCPPGDITCGLCIMSQRDLIGVPPNDPKWVISGYPRSQDPLDPGISVVGFFHRSLRLSPIAI